MRCGRLLRLFWERTSWRHQTLNPKIYKSSPGSTILSAAAWGLERGTKGHAGFEKRSGVQGSELIGLMLLAIRSILSSSQVDVMLGSPLFLRYMAEMRTCGSNRP